MSTNSKYFDSIRLKKRTIEPDGPRCSWRGCNRAGTHKAPKGRGHEGEYLYFCVDHVRAYNRSYNYFDGMPEEDVAEYQKQNVTGHRPTWTLGVNGAGQSRGSNGAAAAAVDDPLSLLGERFGAVPEQPRVRPVSKAARKAFDSLGLDPGTTADDIKAKYKMLVKRHHPDANGGTRDAGDRLVEIIQAYRYLRSAGFC